MTLESACKWRAVLALGAAALSAGCAARDYRVAKVSGMYYVYPPGKRIDRKAPLRKQRVPLDEPTAAGGARCRFTGAAFQLAWQPRPVMTTRLDRVFTPGSQNQEKMREAIDEFRTALDELEAGGCLPPGGAERTLVALSERVPMFAGETSYLRYGFNRWRNYIDLRPGMSLGLQYAFSRGPEPWGKNLADMDIGMRAYSVRPREGGAGVTLVREDETITAGGAPREPLPDLARSRMPYHRLFFLTKYLTIKGEPERSATLLGARTVAEIREATPRFFEDADLTCRGKLTRHEPECTSVDKKISFVPEIPVMANGKGERVGIGTHLAEFLNARRALGRPFTLERRYGSVYHPVVFPPGDADALRLPLLTDDRVTYDPAPPRAARAK